MPEHANLLKGRWTSSATGGRFELRAVAHPSESLGTWPTSGPPDVELALEACSEATDWSRRSFADRRLVLLQAARGLAEDALAVEEAAQAVGLRSEEMRAHVHGLGDQLDRLLSRDAGSDASGVALCAPFWSDLFQGALARCATELLSGRPVLLVADPRLPVVADRLARALLEAGVGEGAVAVLHGLTREGCGAAVDDARVNRVVASAWSDRIAWWRRACERAGVTSQSLDVPRAVPMEVDVEKDLEPQAVRIVDGAFGRTHSVFGQRRAQVARVFCPQDHFSRFSEVLLSVLEDSEPAKDPLPLIDREMEREVRRHWAVGLDDGATLIFGGEAHAHGDAKRCVMPTVFTNVEPHMACARRQEPIPVLCLLRASARGDRGRGL